ncbi:TonB-dependent siderophore receptor [Nitrosomonas marina]|uniref:Iron complex outermembrane recepter protein n=1 Tax=Nitrosomonas marina TaxID=917 RepID=A0A1H8C4R0_9PROT|nr:TonB-dependent receptor [Nitrosomonas marina]SEM90050.1 iron complex outermembrane recepter protein [Nitrosomonas marina]
MNNVSRALVFYFLLAGPVLAQSTTLNIPAQTLQDALYSLSSQTGIQLLFDAENMKNLQSRSVKGSMNPETALDRLLADTPYTYEASSANTYVIKAAPTEKPHLMPEVKVTGMIAPDSPYSKRYNVPSATTATKTNTPIMETPMGIQVVPKSVLNDQQAITLEQSLNNISGVFPGLGFNGVETFNIRGFDTFDYYRNGVRFQSALTQTGNREIANLERIEVLKGPASILFGRIEPGGMINLVPKAPQANSYYSLQQQFGSYNLYRTTLDATGGLNQDDSLLYRLNFAYEDKGSFRQFVNNHHFFVAPVIQWRISNRTQITAEMEYKTGKFTPDYGFPAIGNRPANLPVNRNLGESFSKGSYDEITAGFHWSHALNDNWEIKHRFYLQRTDEEDNAVIPSGLRTDNRILDRFFAGFRNNDVETYTTNVDITGNFETFGIRHTVLMGGDYYNFKNSGLLIDNFNFPSIDILNPIHGGTAARDPLDDFLFATREDWFGLYFQDQIKLPYNVHILAGFRYDNARIEADNTFGGVTTFLDSKQDRISPRVGVLWQPVPFVSFYGNYVENFGAPNLFATGINGQSLRAETAQQWEAGIKTEFFDGRLSATAAWFQLTKQNMAVGHPDPQLAAQGFSVLTGEARNEGVELDINGELLPGWNVIANYAYIDSDITRANDATLGNRFPNVPKHAGNIWSTYAFQNESLRGLKIGGGVTLRGKREGNLDNDFQMPGYAVFNLMTSYAIKLGKARLTAQFNVNNLFDKEYFPSSGGFNRMRITVGTPRVFLGSIRIEY